MTESLWDEDPTPQKSKRHTRRPQPMAGIMPPMEPVVAGPRTFAKREKPRDFPMEEALRNCAPILHPDEIAALPEIFARAQEPTVRAHIQDWRMRNGLA